MASPGRPLRGAGRGTESRDDRGDDRLLEGRRRAVRRTGCAFALGRIHVANTYHEAEVSRMWLRLEDTYIGTKQAARVREKRPRCEWVVVEGHELVPRDGRVRLKSLREKLAAEELPRAELRYEEDAPACSYFLERGGRPTPPRDRDQPVALDLFAGGGGTSVGLKRAGWNVKYKVDRDDACCQTLRRNFRNKKIFIVDVTKFLRDLKSGRAKVDTERITLVHGAWWAMHAKHSFRFRKREIPLLVSRVPSRAWIGRRRR